MAPAPETAALIVAAGKGLRAGSGGTPKQYQALGGRPVLARTLDLFLGHPGVGRVQIVIGSGDEERYASVAPPDDRLMKPVIGGDSRQASVRNGLAALAGNPPDRVLIHDAVRPFAGPDLIDRVIAGLDRAPAVIPAMPVADTLKRVDGDLRVTATVPRDRLYAAETPQGFAFGPILAAHQRAAEEGRHFTDDAAVAEWACMAVEVVAGDAGNFKLTTAAEIAAADRRLLAEEALRLGDLRVGVGYDVHPLGAGVAMMLGGVAIPHRSGLVGHSDADVVLHALTDAVLGALGDADIGEHFPSSDARWKDASSDRFLADAAARVKARGGVIAHLDVTYVGEGPKVAPHRQAIRRRIAAIAGISLDRVGVKATTSEGLGFIGRGEGVAAHAIATIRLPFATSP